MDYNKLLKRVLDIGEKMLVYGAEVSRVEDSMKRMLEVYDVKHIDIFVITSSMIVTIETMGGEIITQMRSIKNLATDLDKLDYLNDLSRQICKEKLSPDEIETLYDKVISRPKYSVRIRALLATIGLASFTIFFGGNIVDALLAGIIGVLIIVIEHFFKRQDTHEVVYYLVVSAFCGITAILLSMCFSNTHSDKIMIGTIMILIPGIPMTNSIRDMMLGDTISGLLRLTQSIIIAVAIAFGFAFALFLFGG